MGYQPGKWKAICDVCGFVYMNDELMDRWDGLKVCRKDWEPRHPMDFLRLFPETNPDWVRTEPADVEIGPDYPSETLYWEASYTLDVDPDITSTWYIDPTA